MGSQCCTEQEEVNPYTKKLIRASYVNILQNEKKQNKQGVIKIYDVETNISNTFPVKFSYFKDLDSISQISIGNNLFLCGEQGNFDSGSAFIKFDLASSIKTVSILVNSIYRHFKPSLCSFKKDFIIAVGGRANTQCEIFHKTSNKWRKLPELPEERYGAGLISDDINDSIYLFGGYNTSYKAHCKSVLKLNLKIGVNWETLIVKNSSLLGRSFFALLRPHSSKSVILIGGQNDEKSSTNEIIEYDFTTKISVLYDYTLEKPCCFDTNTAADFENILFTQDDDNVVHKISRREAKVEIVVPLETDKSGISQFERNSYAESFDLRKQMNEEKVH